MSPIGVGAQKHDPDLPAGWVRSPIGVGAQKHDPDLPAGWVRTKFSEIYELAYGKSLTKNTRNPGGKYPVFGSNGVVGYHDAFLVEGPTIVVGRKGAAGAVSFSPKPCWPIDTTYYVRDGGHIDVQFSFYLITSLRLNQLDRSTAIPGLNRDDAYHLVIRLPPLPEQHRIVAKIEQLFSELDKGIESLKTARTQLATYRQAVLKHAFEGKLTAQWREANKGKLETPEQLLARIKQERAALYERQLKEWRADANKWEGCGKQGKKPSKPKKLAHIPPLASEHVLALPKLPEGWSWFSLSAIAGNIQIGPFGSLLHKADYLVGGTPLVNPSHILCQRIKPDRTLTVGADKLNQLGKYVMHENDIIIGRRGEMGRCAVVTAAEAGWLCGTGSLFVRLLSSMNPHFYSWVLGSQRAKNFLAVSSIGTTMRNLNEGILHRVPVSVCSRHEQDEVFREIERQYSTLDHIETAIDSEITKSASLRQSILKKAFAGQLVAQDPNDEPASILLNRIKAEREKTVKNKTPKKKNKRETAA